MDRVLCRPLGIPSASLVELAGALHGPASQELSRVVRQAAHGSVRWIIFDLRAAGTLDSQAIGALLLACRLCEGRSGRAILLSPPPAVTLLLEALGIASRFLVSDDYNGILQDLSHRSASGEVEW